jgi:glycolate oxidase
MPNYVPLDANMLSRVRDIFGEGILVSSDDLTSYAHDESGLSRPAEAVVFAENAGQVSALLRLANDKHFPVTPRGTGTGLAGGAICAQGGVILSLEKMTGLSIDAPNLCAMAEPGVLTKTLRDAAIEVGLYYPPDPASLDIATIGGNAATDAGGPACVKYGVTKDYVLGLTAVLPTGEIIDAGVATRKGVVGYDLTRLLVGSEGTLGVITKLILKLIPHPPATSSLAALFPNARAAVKAVGAVMTSGLSPSALELMDHKCLRLVADLLPFPLPGSTPAMLLLETDGDPEQAAKDITRVGEICRDFGALELLPAPDAKARETLWGVRRQISLRIHDSAAVYLPEDVVVPISRIPDLIDALPAIEKKYDLVIYAFGHAGDGNIHLNVTADDPAKVQKAEASIRPLIQTVLDLGGTMSGEHGVGLAKKTYIAMELPKKSLELQRGIKALFDPNGILNPGKIF